MICLNKNINYQLAQFLKRSIDLTASFVGLVLTMPLFIVVPVLIKFESEGPVIYKRKVIGLNGVPFSAYKFRTMVKDADKILENDPELSKCFLECFKLKQDPRITHIGYFLRKYSLDEIPQLINVLRGQMSLVGPRMMTAPELECYGEHRELILSVKPGLTGLWQVSGRNQLSFDEMIEAFHDAILELSPLLEAPFRLMLMLDEFDQVEQVSHLLRSRLLRRASRSFRTVDGEAAVVEVRNGSSRYHFRFVPGTLSGYMVTRAGQGA